jgi:hypothetical protein
MPVKKHLWTARKYRGGVRRVTYWGFYILLFAWDFSYFLFFLSVCGINRLRLFKLPPFGANLGHNYRRRRRRRSISLDPPDVIDVLTSPNDWVKDSLVTFKPVNVTKD